MAQNKGVGSVVDMIADRVRESMNGDIQSMIESAMLKAFGSSETHRATNPEPADPPVVRRRRRVQNPSKVYARNYTGRRIDLNLFPTAQTIWSAIVKASAKGQTLSAADLERVTGLGKKTVESCVWYLRNHDADGRRVKPGSKALIVSETFSK